MIIDFFKVLGGELLRNGKMLTGYVLLAAPYLTDYPTLVSALERFANDPTGNNFAVLLAQTILILGAGNRAVKILKVAGKIAKVNNDIRNYKNNSDR